MLFLVLFLVLGKLLFLFSAVAVLRFFLRLMCLQMVVSVPLDWFSFFCHCRLFDYMVSRLMVGIFVLFFLIIFFSFLGSSLCVMSLFRAGCAFQSQSGMG